MKKKKYLLGIVLLSAAMVIPAYAEAKYYVNPSQPYNAAIHGVFNNQPVKNSEVQGIYSVYIPQNLQPWRPVVMVLTPNGVTAEMFMNSEIGTQWRQTADKYNFAVSFLQPDERWNNADLDSERDDAEYVKTVYTQLRSKSTEFDAVFTTDKSHISLIGYEEGAGAAYKIAAEYPAIFCNLTAVNAKDVNIDVIRNKGEQLSYPFPADSFNGKYEISEKNSTIPVPVLSLGEKNDEAVSYWTNVNGENADTRVEGMKNPEQIWTEFMSINGRFLSFPGGTLDKTEQFTANVNGRGYNVSEQNIDGFVRRWLTYVPESYNPANPAPLVMVHHGYSASMYAIAEESKWSDVADKYGFIVVFPQGYLNERAGNSFVPVPTWNSNLFPLKDNATNDVSFIRQVIEETKKNYNIDNGRVYAIGHSNGASMTWLLGREMTDTFAAIAPIGLMSNYQEFTDEKNMLPVWAFMGEYDGSGMELSPMNNNIKTLSLWKTLNGVEKSIAVFSNDLRFTTRSYENSNNVPLVKFTGVSESPHCYIPEESWMIWEDFFSKYRRGENGEIYYENNLVTK